MFYLISEFRPRRANKVGRLKTRCFPKRLTSWEWGSGKGKEKCLSRHPTSSPADLFARDLFARNRNGNLPFLPISSLSPSRCLLVVHWGFFDVFSASMPAEVKIRQTLQNKGFLHFCTSVNLYLTALSFCLLKPGVAERVASPESPLAR